jgi:hypothetical protein
MYKILTMEEKEQRKKEREQKKYNKTHKIINNVEFKFCNRHYLFFPSESEWLPCTEEYFYKNKSNNIDGLNTWCKKCSKKKAIKQWKDDPIKHRESHKKYEKTLKFRKWTKKNHQEFRDYKVQYRKDNKDKLTEYAKRHRKHDITESEWQACQKAFNFCCAYCGKTLTEQYEQNNEQFHREHVDDEGYNDLRNCVPACTNCNSTKHKSSIDELIQYHYIVEFTLDKYNKIVWWITEGYKQYIEIKPPYRILRKKNTDNNKYHFELWTVDEKRNLIQSVYETNTNKEMISYLNSLNKESM